MVYSESFQEAFDRMERNTNARDCRDFDELRLVAERYFGSKWYPTRKQLEALKHEAIDRGYFERRERRRFEFSRYRWLHSNASAEKSWRHECVAVRGKSQDRYRDLKTGRFIKKP